MHTFFGHTLPAADLKGLRDITYMAEQLAACPAPAAKIAFMEKVLLSALPSSTPDLLVTHAVQQITIHKGNLPIKELARQLFVSQDAFEKRFRRVVGSSPKQFATVTRLRNTIDNYTPGQSFTELAYAAGYFDQAHFIRDFKTFTGKTPGQFFKESVFW
nr:helix-turn-helix domain-containing protein [Chitinophaga nivalis]